MLAGYPDEKPGGPGSDRGAENGREGRGGTSFPVPLRFDDSQFGPPVDDDGEITSSSMVRRDSMLLPFISVSCSGPISRASLSCFGFVS